MNKLLKIFVFLVILSLIPMLGLGFAKERVVVQGGTRSTRSIDDFITSDSLVGSMDADTFYVDSDKSSAGDGKSWNTAKTTLDAAVGLCTDTYGDVIKVAANHAENLSTADGVDVDVDGVTIEGLGNGSDMPEFTFTAAAGEFVIGASNVTIRGLRFIPGATDVLMAISVEAGGDNLIIEDCEFVASGTSVYEFLDFVDLASGADNVTIRNCKVRNDTSAASNHFVEAGNGVNANLTIVNNDIQGRFAISAIWSDTVDTLALIANNTILNSITGQHCVEFTGNATGYCVGNDLYGDTEGSILDPGHMYTAYNSINVATDTVGLPDWVIDTNLNHLNKTSTGVAAGGDLTTYVADASALSHIMTKDANTSDFVSTTDSLEAIADRLDSGTTVMSGIDLDHLNHTDTSVAAHGDLTTYVADGSILSHIMTKDANTSDYDSTTDSLEAIADRIDSGTTVFSGINLDHLNYTTTGVAADADLTTYVADTSILAHIMTDNGDTSEYRASTDSLEAIANAVATVTSGLGGTEFFAECTLTSNEITMTTDGCAVVGPTSGGGLLLKNIYANTDTTGLAGPTNVRFFTMQTNGDSGVSDPVVTEATAGLPASISWNAEDDATSNTLPVYIASGESIYITGDDDPGSGAGIAYLKFLFERVDSGATVSGVTP